MIIHRTDGLGSRLMAIGNGIRIARALGVPCYLSWSDPQEVGGISDPGELFDMRRLGADVKVLRLGLALMELAPKRIGYAGTADVIDREIVTESDVLLCMYARMQRFNDETAPQQLRTDFTAAMGSLVPVPQLVDRARAFAARHGLARAIGVHVRRGDLIGHREERERMRLINLESYFGVLDAVAPDGAFFLCTDEQSVVSAFESRYSGRVFRYPTTAWARDDRAATGDALIEMILLGATRFILGGPSGFSRFAATRRGIPLVVLRNGRSMETSIEMAHTAMRITGLRGQRPHLEAEASR